MKDKEKITAYYNNGGEFNRLEHGSFKLEKARTQRLIARFLRKKKMKILDVGGGAGVYSFWLAALGNETHLIDLAPANIREAVKRAEKTRAKPVSMAVGDACSLPFKDNSFDMVLLLGPLYHITEEKLRLKAVKEAKRVLKKGGVLLAAAISRHASLFAGFFCDQNLLKDPEFVRMAKRDVKSGQHRNITKKDYHTTAYYHTVEGLELEMNKAGFKDAEVLPIEGFGCIIPEFDRIWSNRAYRKIIESYACELECEASIKGMSAHLMAIGIKR